MTVRLEVERILCPTDFSEFSERALRLSVGLARWFGARVTVLHVVSPLLSPSASIPSQEAEASLRVQAGEDLAAFVAPVLHEPVTVEKRVRVGDPAGEIEAEAAEAELIVMGTHGRSGFEHLLLGSVTERVLREAPCPVLTVCGGSRPTTRRALFDRVLCAADLGPGSKRVVAFALAMAEENQAELVLLHVIEGLPDAGAATRVGVPVGDGERLRVDLESFALDRLRTAVPAAAREAGASVREEVAQGKPAREILRVAGERSVDLIVLGAHSRGPLVRAFFGSTSDEVVRASGCPVLTVRETRRPRRQPRPEVAGKAGAGVPRA